MTILQEEKQRVHRRVDSLPIERLDEVETLLEQLRRESRVGVRDGKPIVRLGGLWQDLNVEFTDDAGTFA